MAASDTRIVEMVEKKESDFNRKKDCRISSQLVKCANELVRVEARIK